MIKYELFAVGFWYIRSVIPERRRIVIKKIKKFFQTFFERADIFLLVICILSSIYGIIMVYLAAAGMEGTVWVDNPRKYVIVQTLSLFIGIGAFVVFTVIDSDILGKNWKVLVSLNIVLLIALVIFGQDDGTGNKSWIRFAGIGIQPSEIIKVFYIVVCSKQMTDLKEHGDISSFMSVVQMVGHFLLVFGGIMAVSSDLGSCTIIMLIFLIMFFVVGVKLFWFAAGGAAVAAMVPLLWNYFLKDYQKNRLIAPYNEAVDPEGYGIRWQTNQSRLTLASGRFTGVEEGHTTTAFTGKHTDFIFSCVGEQLGMIGCILVLILLTVIIIHCFRVGLHCGRTYDMLICVGVGSAVACQTFVNVGMCIGITPVIGITLPFFSYGGSSMVTMFAAMGLVSGVKYKPKPSQFILAL